MHWREEFRTHAHAVHAVRSGRPLTIRQRAAAHQVMGELQTGNLGSISSFLKKAVKIGAKISPSHYVAKALKIDKFSPSQILMTAAESKSKKTVATAPPQITQEVQPTAPAPVSAPADFMPSSFVPSGGGGGAASFAPTAAADPAATDDGMSMPLIMGLAALGLVGVYLLARGRK